MYFHKHMHVVWHAVDAMKNALLLFANTPNVIVQITLVLFVDDRLVILRANHYVV